MSEPVALRLLPDALHITYAFLATQPELVDLVDDRVYTVLPTKSRRFPFLWLYQVGSTLVTPRPWWAERSDIQLAAYAATDRQARQVCDTARALCMQRLVGNHPDGVVAYVTAINLSPVPDDSLVSSTGRALPRWVTTVTVTAHPLPQPPQP